MSENDEWVQVALTDNAIVADLIVRLRQAPLLPPRKAKVKASAPMCPSWNVRQQRSKQATKEKARESPIRASPTTPLSWSEATSVSGGAAEGAEESSRFAKLINSARSESLPAATNTSEGQFNRRGRKRKQTVAELREMESSLLNENILLKSELAKLRSDVEKARAVNACLKGMTVDVLSQHMMETFTAVALQPVVARDPISQDVACIKLDQCLPNRSSEGASKSSFVLPDLNITVEEPGFQC